jgi:hypothetical protein
MMHSALLGSLLPDHSPTDPILAPDLSATEPRMPGMFRE